MKNSKKYVRTVSAALWSLLLLMGCAGLILAVRRIRRS